MKTIEEFLKQENARLSYDYRWLVWDDIDTNWTVYSHHHRMIYNGEYLESALEALRTGVR